MENQETQPQEEMWQKWEKEHKRGKIMGGIVIVIVGALFLAREMGVIFPAWLLTWKTVLIGFGLFLGIKQGFRSAGWLVPIIVGGAFLVSDLYPELAFRPLIWPVAIILFGLMVIFRPHRSRHHQWRKWQRNYERHHGNAYQHHKYDKYSDYDCDDRFTKTETTSNDTFDYTAFMASVKKNILSKNFRNGEVTAVFGGTKVDFSQADIDHSAVLEVTNVFAGTQLVVPANWEIRSEIVCVFGSVEDKRPQLPLNATEENRKVLVLKGTVFFGGLEIRSYNESFYK